MAVNKTVAWQDRKVREGVEHIDQLLFHPNNPKVHPIRQTNAVKAAIRELGWMAKVKVNLRTSDQWPDGERGVEVVIDGHDRIKAAAQDGQDTVPVEYYDLTPNEESLFLLTYDPIGTMFARDRETTERLMQEVATGEAELMTFLGQEAEELGIVLGELSTDNPPGDAEPQTNQAEELRQKWGVELGQMWRLPSRTPGQEHRLICGDCTDGAVVARVMGGEKADISVTSPPYNQSIDKFKPSGMHRDGDWVAKVERLSYFDSLPENEYQQSQVNALDICFDELKEGASMFYNHKNRYRDKKVVSPLTWLPGKFSLRQEIIWSRPGSVTQNARMFLPSDERIYWMYKGEDFYFNDSTEIKSYSTVWDINLETNKSHAVAYPLELPTRCIRACSIRGSIVLEPYAGSGTTIIAAENLSRQCRAVEISQNYVAVALQRYLDAFGITPELVP